MLLYNMADYTYIEDIFLEFHDRLASVPIGVQHHDRMASSSFYNLLVVGSPITVAQSKYILKLLDKYKISIISPDFDYRPQLLEPKWKTAFRILDETKKVYVEKDSNQKIWVCLKHPFAYKEKFEKEVLSSKTGDRSYWDPEGKIRKFPVYELNLLLVQEFAMRHNFEIDETFSFCMANVEEMWMEADTIIPHSRIIDNDIVLANAKQSAIEYFDKFKTDNFYDNLFLAKNLGYRLETEIKPKNIVEKIASSNKTHFWVKDSAQFFDLYKKITGKVCFIVGDDQHLKSWMEKFIQSCDSNAIPREDIRVCFRERNDQSPEFNNWVKENNLGGPVGNARILIFKNKPAKWLFNKDVDVKLIVVNKPFPPSSMITQSWFNEHPCVIYLDGMKPSLAKDKDIEHL